MRNLILSFYILAGDTSSRISTVSSDTHDADNLISGHENQNDDAQATEEEEDLEKNDNEEEKDAEYDVEEDIEMADEIVHNSSDGSVIFRWLHFLIAMPNVNRFITVV